MSNNVEFHDVNQQKTAADFSGKLKFQHLNKNVKLQSSDKKTKVLLSDIKEIIQNGLADIYGNDKDVKYRYIVDLILKRVKSCLNDLSVQSKKDIQTELASVKKEITSDFKDLLKQTNLSISSNQVNDQNNSSIVSDQIIDYLNKYFESKHNDFIGLLSDIQDNINTDILEKLEDIEDKADIQLKKIQVKDKNKNKDKDKKNNLDDIFKSNNNITKYVKSNVNKINNVSRDINKNFGYVNRNINQTNLNISSKISNISTKLKDNLDRSFNFISRSVSTILSIAISPIKSMFNIITLSLKGIGHGIKNVFKFIFTPAGMYITLMLASIIWKVFKKPITAFYEHHIKPTVDKINEVINDPTRGIFDKIKDSLYILYDDIIVNKLFKSLHEKVFEPFGNWFLGFLYRNRWNIFKALGLLWLLTNPIQTIQLAIFGISLLLKPFKYIFNIFFPSKLALIQTNTDLISKSLHALHFAINQLCNNSSSNNGIDISQYILDDDITTRAGRRRIAKRLSKDVGKNLSKTAAKGSGRVAASMKTARSVSKINKINNLTKISRTGFKSIQITKKAAQTAMLTRQFHNFKKVQTTRKALKTFKTINTAKSAAALAKRGRQLAKVAQTARIANRSIQGIKAARNGLRVAGAALTGSGVGIPAALVSFAVSEIVFGVIDLGISSYFAKQEAQERQRIAYEYAVQVHDFLNDINENIDISNENFYIAYTNITNINTKVHNLVSDILGKENNFKKNNFLTITDNSGKTIIIDLNKKHNPNEIIRQINNGIVFKKGVYVKNISDKTFTSYGFGRGTFDALTTENSNPYNNIKNAFNSFKNSKINNFGDNKFDMLPAISYIYNLQVSSLQNLIQNLQEQALLYNSTDKNFVDTFNKKAQNSLKLIQQCIHDSSYAIWYYGFDTPIHCDEDSAVKCMNYFHKYLNVLKANILNLLHLIYPKDYKNINDNIFENLFKYETFFNNNDMTNIQATSGTQQKIIDNLYKTAKESNLFNATVGTYERDKYIKPMTDKIKGKLTDIIGENSYNKYSEKIAGLFYEESGKPTEFTDVLNSLKLQDYKNLQLDTAHANEELLNKIVIKILEDTIKEVGEANNEADKQMLDEINKKLTELKEKTKEASKKAEGVAVATLPKKNNTVRTEREIRHWADNYIKKNAT